MLVMMMNFIMVMVIVVIVNELSHILEVLDEMFGQVHQVDLIGVEN